MKSLVIITKSENEVRVLKPNLNNVGFWGQKQMDYDVEWHWILNKDGIYGTSGYNSLSWAIEKKSWRTSFKHS